MKPHREYACILVPDFPWQALRRAEPDLAGRPVAVLGEGHCIAHVSPEAHRAGIRPGMTPAQARSIQPHLSIRAVPAAVVRSAHQALLDLAWGFSPRVEDRGAGVVLLDLAGTHRLYPSRPALGCALHAACRRMGFLACIAMAPGPRLALVAARGLPPGEGSEPVLIVPHGEEARKALAPLPLSALDPPPALAETLTRLGLRTVGDLARLDRRGIGVRLGLDAYHLHRLAHGEDPTPLQPRRPEEVFVESVALEYPIEQVEPLLFLLGAAIERLASRLDSRCLVPAFLRLTLDLDPQGHHAIEIAPALPTADVRALLGLLRLRLEQGAPGSIRGFTLEAQGGPAPRVQADLFGPPGPDPSRLGTLLARLQAVAGEGRVGQPGLSDNGHRPRPHVRPFSLAGPRGAPVPEHAHRTLCFCRLSPALPIEVRLGPDGLPVWVEGNEVQGPVQRVAGPWYVGTGWWTGRLEVGASYDVEVRGVGLFRLWHDLVSDQWSVEGWYD